MPDHAVPELSPSELLAAPQGCDQSPEEAARALRARSAQADPLSILPDVHPARLPRHVAIIMDGNGRWAQSRGFPREFGHRNGARSVRTVLEECGRLGIEYLTLYSFSLENWKRPAAEIDALMQLCIAYCDGEREELVRSNVRCLAVGRIHALPGPVQAALQGLVQGTAHCTGTKLVLAINYGSRAEIADAARRIAQDVAAGALSPGDVDETQIESRLYTAGIPDPDLLVRTAGELRVSNFLLWQISYAEIYVTQKFWPDFERADLHRAVREYAGRRRRFGGLS